MDKRFNGKAIYQPQGAAEEYAKYACNFFKGCSNSCSYCFNKRWNWGNVPKLKACFKDEEHALEVFEKELKANLPELQKHGLFFSFATDPMLPETQYMTTAASYIAAAENKVPVKILTKMAFDIDHFLAPFRLADLEDDDIERKHVAFGFTLTGYDELEPFASPNAERIEAMRRLHEAGFKTWASIEPVIDLKSSWQMIKVTRGFCDLYKIGLESGKKYDKMTLYYWVKEMYRRITSSKIYFKDSLLAQAGISRSELPDNCVSRDYDLFNS